MDPIIDKIKKLLRMRRGGTDAEVETALRLATELARKHNIDLNSVNPDSDSEPKLGHEDSIIGARIQCECKYSALVVEQFFNVSIVLRDFPNPPTSWRRRRTARHGISFVGTRRDREIAVYVYHFLVGRFRHNWRRRDRKIRNRASYMAGMYEGICESLRRSRIRPEPGSDEWAIEANATLSREDYMTRSLGKLTRHKVARDPTEPAARLAGWIRGLETRIRPAVEKAAAATHPMLIG